MSNPELKKVNSNIWRLASRSPEFPSITLMQTGDIVTVDITQFLAKHTDIKDKSDKEVLNALEDILKNIQETIRTL